VLFFLCVLRIYRLLSSSSRPRHTQNTITERVFLKSFYTFSSYKRQSPPFFFFLSPSVLLSNEPPSSILGPLSHLTYLFWIFGIFENEKTPCNGLIVLLFVFPFFNSVGGPFFFTSIDVMASAPTLAWTTISSPLMLHQMCFYGPSDTI